MTFDPNDCSQKVQRLTPRQRDILRGIANCKSSKMIADELGISEKRVVNLRGKVYSKLRIHSTAEAVRVAVAAGIS